MIYLDNNATTRLDPRVLEAMMPFLTEEYANAASTHPFGVRAHEAVKLARQQVAQLLGCEPTELIFTSGATEAINLAIKGVADSYASRGKHIVTVQTEHTAVLDVCRYLEGRGYEVTYLPVQPDGLLDLATVQQAIRPDTILVSVMAVNNETGVIQPIQQIAELAHAAGALFMTDATQAVGKMPLDVEQLGVDLLMFSGHKLYGPKGVGGLYVRHRKPRRVKMDALLHGGGHERGMRSGTLNVPGIVGLGQAAELCRQTMKEETVRIEALRDELEAGLLAIPGTRVNGNRAHRLYNTTNILFEGCDSDAMIMGLEGIAVSNGSACTAASVDPSHVLLAMGLNETEAFSCLRFSLGRFCSETDINICESLLGEVVGRLRSYAL
ncbi:cysteine desulfurase [Hymenobacter sp. BT186]|uniref:cysteine desulfurase n=1 Tax=Hymenobacter telluris TaxID=2816474 RepID=A0A939JFX2_9BACT|nr:cysteine desulfurase family protein [Hymenobacter telluris]MBO0360882.1 cysteine desulfurase [Hymenobacter telluris]MBW3376911.1 cysteine desulfurase [Hymenobacter norwichensis]